MKKVFDPNDLAPNLRCWLEAASETNASDLHLVHGYPAILRCHGKLVPHDSQPLGEADIFEALAPIVGDVWLQKLPHLKNADLAFSADVCTRRYRLRFNLFMAGNSIGACIRIIPDAIPDFSWASFPEDLAKRIGAFQNGLVLFTGVTGSGKSTSLAMIINQMNRLGGFRILTIEDPIEYLFPLFEHSVVTQREVGTDVDSFADGLKYGLRQDPDLVLVGEIRDCETAKMALSAAETGHLVLSTLHTRDAKGAISRYTDMFPQNAQNEIRAQLASNLRAVVCQRLLDSSVPGEKQELALEVMFNNSAIGAAIRNAKLESIDNYILTGRSDGMITMDESIKRLVSGGRIRMETAEPFIQDRTQFQR
ncbi:MAG: PilT/PilU family type 4a pilus ATPase [Pirellula sp.]